MKQAVAYLGRPTVDHREIISATVRPGPLPIHTAGDIPALIGTADVTIDNDVVWADPTFTIDEPDWDLWCLTVQLDQADIAYNNDQTGWKMAGRIAGLILGSKADWPWGTDR